MIDEHDLREMLRRRASTVPTTEVDAPKAARRGRRRLLANGALAVLATAAIAGATFAGIQAVRTAPIPADRPTPRLPEMRGNGEVLVFERLGTGPGWDLAAQDPGSGEVRKIVETDGIVDCTEPSRCTNVVESAEWSSDGRWVAFEVSNSSIYPLVGGPCGPTVGIWVQRASGDPRQLTTPCDATPGADAPEETWTWSPSGARLAYARIDGETDELFVIDPSDGRRTSLGTADEGLIGEDTVGWSPDGSRIAYADGDSVYVIDADGGERSLLADSFDEIIKVAWSPDGTHILVHDQGRYRIQVMNADGSDLHPVLEGEDACCSTGWSPNGDRILYMVTKPVDQAPEGSFSTEVWTVSPDGSNRIQVFDSSGCVAGESADASPVWAPSGTRVAYHACSGWVLANADGTGEAQPIDELAWRSWGGGGLSARDLFS